MRRWKGCVFFLLLMLAVLAGGLYYLFQGSFQTPEWMRSHLRKSMGKRFRAPVDFGRISVAPSHGRLEIHDLQIGSDSQALVCRMEQMVVECDDATHLTAFLRDELSARLVQIVGVTVDLERLRTAALHKAPKEETQAPPPFETLTAERVLLDSKAGKWLLARVDTVLLPVSGLANVRASVTETPLGGLLTASASFSLSGGDSAVDLIWEKLRPDPLIGIWRWLHPGWPEILGEWALNLQWRGNVAQTLDQNPRNWKQLLGQQLTGSVSCSEGAFSWLGVTATTSLVLNRATDEAWKARVGLGLASGVVNINGQWDPQFEGRGLVTANASFAGEVLPEPWLHQLAPDMASSTSGILNGDMMFKTNGEWLETAGTATATGWKLEKVASLTCGLSWIQSGTSVLATGSLEAPMAHIEGGGQVSLASGTRGDFTWKGRILRWERRNWEKLFNLDVQGSAEGDFFLKGRLNNPETLSYEANLEVMKPYLFGLETEHLSGLVRGTGPEWHLINPVLVISSGSWAELDGEIGHAGYVGRFRAEGFPLSLLGVPPQEARGEVTLDGKLSGPLKLPGFSGDFFIQKPFWQGVAFQTIRGQLDAKNHTLTVSPLLAGLEGGGTIDGGFEFDLKRERLQALRLGFDQLPIERLRSFLPPDLVALNPSGMVSGLVQRHWADDEAWWEFKLSGNRVLLASETFHDLNFEAAAASDSLEIRSLDAKLWKGQVEIHGRLDRVQADLEVSARDLQIQHSQTVQGISRPSSGLVSLQGNLEFGARRRAGYFTLFGKDLSVGGQTLGNLGAEVAIDAVGLKIVRADLDGIGMQLDGSVGWSAGNPYQWKLHLKHTDLSFIPSSRGWLGFQRGDVQVTGAMEMAGFWNDPQPREALARFESIEIRRGSDLVVANRPIEIRFQNEAFEIRSLELKYRNGVFGVSGIWNPRGNAALTLTGQDFSLAALARLAGIQATVPEGSLSISGGVSGTYPDIQMKGDLTVHDLEFRGRKVPILTAKCRVDRAGVSVNPLVADFPRNKITAVGNLPFSKDGGLGGMDVQVEVASGPLDDLPVYLPEFFSTAKGWMKASLRFSGNPLFPQITGVARLHGDTLGFKGMKRPLTQVDLGVNTENGLVKLFPVQANLGRGVFSGHGQVDFRDGPGSLTVRLAGQKLDLSWGRIDLERASATVDVSGDLYNPVIVGRVSIPKGKVQIADDLLGKTNLNLNLPLESLKYTVYVDIPRNLWLKNSMLNAEMRGKFTLNGNLNDFQLDGGISTVQGWLTFQRRKFVIDNGEVKFGEQDQKFDPHIYFKSVCNIQNTQVYLVLDGRLSSIKPQLYSSPPMAEGTLLAMLTLGRSADQVLLGTGDKIAFEKEILEGLKNTYLSGLLSSTLSSALNLDELYFDSLFDRTSGVTRSFLRLGKYVGYNIFLAYEGTLSNDGMKTYIIEYRLPRGFLLNVEVEKPRNNTRIGIKYDWKF